MIKARNKLTIVVTDDDPDDRMLIKDALLESGDIERIEFFEDGQELMDYLLSYSEQDEQGKEKVKLPFLVLLDLNMPRKDGRATLQEIKDDPRLKHIPVVILTTSRDTGDIEISYRMGVNSYITKPSSFEEMIGIMKHLIKYWSEVVELPTEEGEVK